MLICFFMIFTSLAQTWMRNRPDTASSFLFFFIPYIINLNLGSICKTQSQLIAMYPDFNRVTHRCIFYHGHVRHGNDSHIQEMLPQGTLSSYYCNCGGFPDGKVF